MIQCDESSKSEEFIGQKAFSLVRSIDNSLLQQILTAAELQICLLLTALGVDNEESVNLWLTLREQQLQRVKVESLAHLTDAGWADRTD